MLALMDVAAFCLGAIAGSFLNALSFRLNTGRGILWESGSKGHQASRSRCMRCGHTLGSLELIPLLSYAFLRGRCLHCRAHISWQYPIVELAAGVLSLLVFWQHPMPYAYALWFVVWMTLLFVVIYDLKHFVIPWSCSILLAALAVILLFVQFGTFSIFVALPSWSALLAGPLLALPLVLLSFVSGGRWMGWGDGALELSLGWFLGLTLGATALMLAFWVGAAAGLALIGLKKGYMMSSELPFAPFLILGAFIAYFTHVDFFASLLFFW